MPSKHNEIAVSRALLIAVLFGFGILIAGAGFIAIGLSTVWIILGSVGFATALVAGTVTYYATLILGALGFDIEDAPLEDLGP